MRESGREELWGKGGGMSMMCVQGGVCVIYMHGFIIN